MTMTPSVLASHLMTTTAFLSGLTVINRTIAATFQSIRSNIVVLRNLSGLTVVNRAITATFQAVRSNTIGFDEHSILESANF
jgi:hypothetical protein